VQDESAWRKLPTIPGSYTIIDIFVITPQERVGRNHGHARHKKKQIAILTQSRDKETTSTPTSRDILHK